MSIIVILAKGCKLNAPEADAFDLEYPVGAASNPKLLAALFTRWMPFMRIVARHLLANAQARGMYLGADVDDFVQDAVVRALQRIHQYDPLRWQFRTWLGWMLRDVFGVSRGQFALRARRKVLAFQLADTEDGDRGIEQMSDPNAERPSARLERAESASESQDRLDRIRAAVHETLDEDCASAIDTYAHGTTLRGVYRRARQVRAMIEDEKTADLMEWMVDTDGVLDRVRAKVVCS